MVPAWSQQTILLLNIAGTDYVNALDLLPKLMPHRHNIAAVDTCVFRLKNHLHFSLFAIVHATKFVYLPP